MILCGLGTQMSPDRDENETESREGRGRFGDNHPPNLGCKFILGLVEGVSCCLQSGDSALDALQGQEGKPQGPD